MCLLSSCGSVGEPVYPSPQMPLAVTDLVALQRGNRILVTFTIPQRTTDGLLLHRIESIDLRIGTGPAPFPSKEWADASASHPMEPPDSPGPVHTIIPLTGLIGKRVTIAERTEGGRHHFSAWSNPVTLDVQTPVPQARNIIAKNGPKGVELSWQGDGDTSFRIFRREEGEKTFTQVGEVNAPSFTDQTSQYDKHYEYFVQALNGKAESEIAKFPVQITPADVFPPAAPAGLTTATGLNAIELAWERNTEPDFHNYVVYRAVGNGPFEKLAEPDSPVYTDHSVKSGTTYRYAIAAVDQTGNVSEKSATVEAAAP